MPVNFTQICLGLDATKEKAINYSCSVEEGEAK